MYERRIAGRVRESLADTPVVFLQGARQVGKSTLARSLAAGGDPAGGRYLSLDSAAALAAAAGDPEGFVAGLAGGAVPAVIDEVQRAPGLALAIKSAVDADRSPGRFLLTGSANVMVVPRLSESLAGRVELHTLWPLSQGEIAAGAGGGSVGGTPAGRTFVDRLFADDFGGSAGPAESFDDLVTRAVAGGFPEALARRDPGRRAAWFDAYVDTVLRRDVREIADVAGLAELPRLLALLATRAASLLNYADVSRALSMPQSTLKRYATLLEATFLVRPVPAWATNLGQRLVKAPKLMLSDTGLLAHLLGVEGPAAYARGRTPAGALLENFAAMELCKQLGWSAARCSLSHFRTPGGAEVDLVLEDRRGRVAGVEVKAAATVRDADLRGLRALAELAGDRFARGVLLHAGDAAVPFGPRLLAMPMATLWSGG